MSGPANPDFSLAAKRTIVQAVQKTLADAPDGRNSMRRAVPRSGGDPCFWAIVTDYVYDLGTGNISYTWVEQVAVGSDGNFSDKGAPNGRSGTANTATALYNSADFFDGARGGNISGSAWIPPNTYVLARTDFKADGTPVFHTHHTNRAHIVSTAGKIDGTPGGYNGYTMTWAYGTNGAFPPTPGVDRACLIWNQREMGSAAWMIPETNTALIPATFAGIDQPSGKPMFVIDVYWPNGFTGTSDSTNTVTYTSGITTAVT